MVLMLVASILLHSVSSASAHYDPEVPLWSKNLSPADANPAGNITCLGSPEFPLPKQGDWDPNHYSLQQLCAEPQYGGEIDRHVGAYCRPALKDIAILQRVARIIHVDLDTIVPPEVRRGSIVFDHTPTSSYNKELSNPRFLRYCKQRCYCKSDETNVGVQPKGYDHSVMKYNPFYNDLNRLRQPVLGAWLRVPRVGYRLKVDVFDDWQDITENFASRSPFLGPPNDHWLGTVLYDWSSKGLFSHIRLLPEGNVARDDQVFEKDYLIYADKANNITCEGELPPFEPPMPYRKADFANLQEMCAMYYSGGNPGANAGGYCHRNDARKAHKNGYLASNVWFSDEVTPRVDWTWSGQEFNFVISLRFHCRKYCRCTSGDYRPRRRKSGIDPAIKLWRFIADSQIAILDGHGNLEISYKGGEKTSQESSDHKKTYTARPECGSDADQYCPATWPRELLGPIPRGPMPLLPAQGAIAAAIATAGTSPADLQQKTQCDLSCTQSSDCVSQSTPGCPLMRQCVVDPSSALQQTYLTTLGKVVTTYAIAMCLRQPGSKGLGRRDVESKEEWRDWPCACNATYVSRRCCDADNGLAIGYSDGHSGILQ